MKPALISAHPALEGAITEETDFSQFLELPQAEIEIDLSLVSRINSCGVREWLNFVRELEARGGRVVLTRCSSAIVGQLNLIYNFLGKSGEVRSVMAPYVCDECGHEEDRLIALEDSPDIEVLTAEAECPKCAELMEFADLPDYYLQFHTMRR